MIHLTQTLISSWLYMMNCWEECKAEAVEDFRLTLLRYEKEVTPEMQNGLDFENEVYKVAAGYPRPAVPKWESGIQLVANEIMGAQIQVKCSKPWRWENLDLRIDGVFDALKAGVIYDVKFSNKSFGSADLTGKYLESPQHPTYFFLEPNAYKFTYLVSDGMDIYTETYTRKNSRPFTEIADEFLSYLKTAGLLEIYKERWAV